MTHVQTIPLYDIREEKPSALLEKCEEEARALVKICTTPKGMIGKALVPFALRFSDYLSKSWLERTENPYREEIERCNTLLSMSGIFTLNLSYEWGCTTGVYTKNGAPVLARTLDWPLAGLEEFVTLAHETGDGGDFFNIVWPGFIGVLSAMAPRRFSVALNQAPMRRHAPPLSLDWVRNRWGTWQSKGLPPAHLLRRVLENAMDYEQAVSMLSKTELALPAIYTIAGVKEGEACVIERLETDYHILTAQDGPVCTTNHFQGPFTNNGYGWSGRNKSYDRLPVAQALKPDDIDESFSWVRDAIATKDTKLALIANAAETQLHVTTFSKEGALGSRFSL